jgi:hypothetical protein
MSQQYGPPGQVPAGQGGYGPQQRGPLPPPGGGRPGGQGGPLPGWGPAGPVGPFGYPPGRFRRPARSKRTLYVVLGSGILAVLLIVVGGVLLVSGAGKEDEQPVAGDDLTPAPVGTLYTPPTPSPTQPEVTRGPNDKGVEVGGGIWFTPAKGWVKDPDKRAGANYLLPEPGRAGAIDGWFWVRQSEFMGAKAFADHLVDVESNNLQHVVIGKGHYLDKCPSPAMKACYATNYSAVVVNKGKPPVIFSGFIQAFEDRNGLTTATDSAVQSTAYDAHKPEIRLMNESLVRSF